jgi:hypothetical protein
MALQWKPSEPGRTRGSSLEVNETLLKQILQAVKETKSHSVETEMKSFLKEMGYEGQGTPSTVTYLINKRLRASDIPLKCGYTNQGKNIKFFAFEWPEEKETPDEKDE